MRSLFCDRIGGDVEKGRIDFGVDRLYSEELFAKIGGFFLDRRRYEAVLESAVPVKIENGLGIVVCLRIDFCLVGCAY